MLLSVMMFTANQLSKCRYFKSTCITKEVTRHDNSSQVEYCMKFAFALIHNETRATY